MVTLRSGNTPGKAKPSPRRQPATPAADIKISVAPLKAKRGPGRPKKNEDTHSSSSSESVIHDVSADMVEVNHDDDFDILPDVGDWQTMLGIRQRKVARSRSIDGEEDDGHGDESGGQQSMAFRLLGDARLIGRWTPYILIMEVFICAAIIMRVPYTEIDWSTYMEQATLFFKGGELDYARIGGATGPIVYPAGHLYIYTLLSFVTGLGANIRIAQAIFALIFVLNVYIVLRIYAKVAEVPPLFLLPLIVTAYRVHSISVLRLFNDPIAMLILHASVLALLHRRTTLGCVLFSVAVSVKMNVLLIAPALGAVLVVSEGWTRALMHGANCLLVQLILAAPFLYRAPMHYLTSSFNMGRVFLFEWTVNWRFLPEEIFVDRRLHAALLVAHLIVLLAFAFNKWMPRRGGLRLALMSRLRTQLTSGDIVFALFTANFIGIMFARSLHYQFYVWYYYSLPFLCHRTSLPPLFKLALPLVIEYCWNVYPSTPASSALLHGVHIVLLLALCAHKIDARR